MIFQQWVLTRCGGKPSEAVRRIEAANGGDPIDRTRVYRALRKPSTLPLRFAQLVVNASGGACTLFELIDLDIIRAHFEYTDPDLRVRALEYQRIRAERRRDGYLKQLERTQAQIAAVDAELAEYAVQLEAATADAPRATG